MIISENSSGKNKSEEQQNIILKGMSLQELQKWAISVGQTRFRGTQLFEWMYREGVDNPTEMTNISKSFRAFLSDNCTFSTLKLKKISKSQTEPTQKFLFQLNDGQFIETVSIIENDRHTVCVSSQIGCNLECDFCATATLGFSRNLSAGEIVDQLIFIRKYIEQPITNIVFMGMGEPFLNYKRVMTAADIFHNPKGFNLASTRITISTGGIVPKIKQFIDENRKYKLAVSLNAPNDEIRSKIMPINNKWQIEEIIKAVKKYSNQKRRKIMFEYVLIKDVNDSSKDAQQLVKLLKNIDCKLNIIPYNEMGGKYQRPDEQTIDNFMQILFSNQGKVRVLTRWSKGQDIDAACGQLATKQMEIE
ncbi:MAG: 23S rRNA (adenine(2503)-C(2))-methyltransferase RlmN [Candidatus Marinimicrobia bacterium]|nr:23S rRNA (adenine(2503)-C(2))-methyltransferase RlmN [Candidatus Neomarinimicrobiota bacterium]MBL7022933.1 23S rRNA (adenine(2503)-C(2))-methyltransferase RlmN [Candidatus Neomarinimicrobiota bacterium]MBL7108751.1 23S rRNA (adenine(2503)-C(2))-methyltransferase RlmN [Candidatus Neomarinimicrobiota bacterium]